MKKTLLFTFIFIFRTIAYAQSEQEKYKIYDKVMENYPKCVVQTKTSLSTIKKFSFENPLKNGLYTKVDTLSHEWLAFLKRVDTSSFAVDTLNAGFVEKYNSAERRIKLVFSPVVFSSDKTMAVCTVYLYGKYDFEGEEAYILEKKNEVWKIIRRFRISIG